MPMEGVKATEEEQQDVQESDRESEDEEGEEDDEKEKEDSEGEAFDTLEGEDFGPPEGLVLRPAA